MASEQELRGAAQAAPLASSGPILAYLEDLHRRVEGITDGAVADYIPKLAEANPAHLGLAIATIDGKVYCTGDADVPFTIQSVSKPFMYGLALETLGREQVLKHVGVEPTGNAFNATVMDEVNNRPFNPMVNAGAIAVSALVAGESYDARRQKMVDLFSRYAGRTATIDEAVFLSERETGDRNRVIASIMAQAAMLQGDTNEILDLYFSQCSVLVTCRDLALMAATLANGGVQPLTGEHAIAPEYVHDVLTVMNSCGMYNYAGQWSYEIGIPAKSGVAGSIIAVIPGQIGIAAFSPRLDRFGNSVRAIAACKQIAADFGLHVFRTSANSGAVIRGEMDGRAVRSKRRRGARERQILDFTGASTAIIEAQGALFFGSAERLVRRAGELADEAKFLILDLRRVFAADAAAQRLIFALYDEKHARGERLIFVHPAPWMLGADFEAAIAARAGAFAQILFTDHDAALEWCENRLIAEGPRGSDAVNFSLAGLDLFQGLKPSQIKALEAIARPFSFEAGQHILREGEEGRLFFCIVQGSASVRLNVKGERGERSVRIASVGAGATIGDMALLDGGPRSADVVADERVVCYGFSVDEIRAEAQAHPDLMPAILGNIARDLAERLRSANNHIRAIEA
ncbi:MAG: glutaminase A [Hyphomonadaceae bacterium]